MALTFFGPSIPTTDSNTYVSALLNDGRVAVISGPNQVQFYSQGGGLLGSVNPRDDGNGFDAKLVAALADGGFVVTGSYGGGTVAFRIYNADLTERTSGRVNVFNGDLFDGGIQTGHAVKALPTGGFVIEWNSVQDQIIGSVGVNGNGAQINPGSASGVDIRASIFDANGGLTSAAGVLVTQGNVTFPSYTINSRFGNQYLYDVDWQADGTPQGRIITTYIGQRFATPSGGDINATSSTPYYYDNIRSMNAATGAAIVGETPDNATASIGSQFTNPGNGLHQTVVLTSGLIAGIYTTDTGVAGAGQYQTKLQLRNADGTPNGIEIDLALQFGGNNVNLQGVAAPTAGGGFVIAYRIPPTYADAGTASLYDVYLREYSATGAVIATQQVTSASGREELLNLTPGPDGTFVLTTDILFDSVAAQTRVLVNNGAGDFVFSGDGTSQTINATGTNRNWVSSGGGADTINGGSGTNYLYGGDGNSTFNGGTGVNVIRGGSGAETMRGGAQNDTLDGGQGADSLDGGAGADRLAGGAGADTLNGGANLDTADYSAAATTAVLRLDTGTQYGQYGSGAGGAVETDILIDIENLIGGSAGDYLYGSASANNLTGGLGNDYIESGDGADTVDGGADRDYVFSAAGADSVLGGLGEDTIYGGTDNDTLVGGDGNDYLYGDQGADSLDGGNGIDVLFMDSADVFANGGAGVDYIVWQDVSVAANLDIAARSADYFYGFTGADAVTAIGAALRPELHGGAGNDTLTGAAGVGSILLGEGDNDRLIGSTGIDHFVGGAGLDTYVIAANGGTDYVYDFKTGGADRVQFLSIPGITAFANLAVNTTYAAGGWYGYGYGSGTVWVNTTAIGGGQPVAGDFLFA